MNRAPSRAAADPRSDVVKTPLPPDQEEDERGLTYKPSQKPWVKLTRNINREFLQNRHVQVYAVQETPDSPTAYPNQDAPWTRTDHDSWYRVQKRCKTIKRTVVIVDPFPHIKLHTSEAAPGNNAGFGKFGPYPFDEFVTVYYLSERYTVMFNGEEFEVPKNTGVTVKGRSSQNLAEEGSDFNADNMYYAIQIYFEAEEWSYVHCMHFLRVEDLASINDGELATLQKKNVSSWRVISAEKVPVNERGKEHVEKDDDSFWE